MLEVSPEGLEMNSEGEAVKLKDGEFVVFQSPEVAPWKKIYQPPTEKRHYPYISPVPASYLVRRVEVVESDKRASAFSYRYGGYRMDLVGMRSLGFEFRESLNELSHVLTRSEYAQDADWRPLPKGERTCLLQLDQIPKDQNSYCPAVPSETPDLDVWRKVLSGSQSWYELRTGVLGDSSVPTRTFRQTPICRTVTASYGT